MQLAKNSNQLSKMLQPSINRALEYTINKMLSELQRHILEDVYYYDYYPNKKYAYGSGHSTMDFLNAFKRTGVLKNKEALQASILYYYDTMRLDSKNKIHTDGNNDLREELAELLNVKGVFAKKKRNAYWDNFIDTVNSHLVEWFEEGFN